MLKTIIGIIVAVAIALVALKVVSFVFGVIGLGLTVGKILAVGLSLSRNGSIGWGIVHFFCGWLYVGYWAFTGGTNKTTA